jgi:hypothetical protein
MSPPAVCVTLHEGIQIPVEHLPSPDSCGLDLWCSNAAGAWVGATLGAKAMTLRVEHAGRSSWLLLWRRPLLPGIVLASGYPYSTVIGDVALFWASFAEVRRCLQHAGMSRVEMALSGSHIVESLPPEADRHISRWYRESLRATRQIIGLESFKSVDALDRSYPANLRWSIRKSIHEGVRISEVGVAEANIAQQLYLQTMNEKGAPAYYGVQRFRLMVEQAGYPPVGRLYLAYVGSKAVGMAAVADAAIVRHLIQVAVPQLYRKYRVADLLVDTAIRDAYSSGKLYFDFMASSVDDIGLVQFKSKWGGVSEDIVYAVFPINRFRSRLIDFLRAGSTYVAAYRAKHVAKSHMPT